MNDRRHGKGLCEYPDGRGTFLGNGKFDGFGKLLQACRNMLAIGFAECVGYGKATFANGDTVVGSWEKDNVSGKAVMYYHGSGTCMTASETWQVPRYGFAHHT